MLKETLARDLKDAMRQKDKVRLGAIRMVQSAITQQEKSGDGPLSDDQVTAVVAKQAKQRRDAAAQYIEADRQDLADREIAELGYIEAYLPAQATDEDIHRTVHEIVQRSGATSMKDMGRVMGEAMSALKGVAEGSRVQAVVRELLSA
ncbi:GatB/YqeY domain-containing protein [Rubrivirga sp.]|uniref:GatB/YqeY domain-containing protein n=1 Tax=Rubrivirga sp. TaxID=1885344 RepID=UPI003C7861AA